MYCETSNRWCPINSSSCKAIEETHVLPKGSLQLICGQTYDLFDHLGPQDCVTFTGSAYTGQNYVTTLTSINIRFHLVWKPTR